MKRFAFFLVVAALFSAVSASAADTSSCRQKLMRLIAKNASKSTRCFTYAVVGDTPKFESCENKNIAAWDKAWFKFQTQCGPFSNVLQHDAEASFYHAAQLFYSCAGGGACY